MSQLFIIHCFYFFAIFKMLIPLSLLVINAQKVFQFCENNCIHILSFFCQLNLFSLIGIYLKPLD